MGIVYLLAEWDNSENLMKYKIGITKNNVSKRIKQLLTGNSREIIMLKEYRSVEYKKVERMLHKQFSHKRDKREWFLLDDEDVFSFLTKCKECEDLIIFLKKNNSLYK